MDKTWKHDELMHDLAGHLRANTSRMVWENMQLGGMWSERPDVYTLNKSYSKPTPLAYEIKVSVSDFRGDITSGKWQKYLNEAAGVIFAVPKGLVTKADIPVGCGLMTRGEESWHTVKRPTIQKVKLSQDTMLKFLIDGINRIEKPRLIHPRCSSEWDIARSLRKNVGDDVAEFIQHKCRAVDRLKKMQDTADEIQRKINDLGTQEKEIRARIKDNVLSKLNQDESYIAHPIIQLKQALKLPEKASHYEIRHAIGKVLKFIDEDVRLQVADKALDDIINQANHSKAQLRIAS